MQGTLSQETNLLQTFLEKTQSTTFSIASNTKLQLSNRMLKSFDEEILSH